MGEILKNIGSKAKSIITKVATSVLPVVIIIGGIAMGLADSGGTTTAYADGASYSDYVNLGDYIVKTDEEGAIPALSKGQMETAIKSCYSGQAQKNMLSVMNELMSVQSNDKVNAAFMIAITQVESSGGTAWDAIDSSTHNWMSVSWGSQWNGDSGKTYTTHHVWCCYESFNEAIKKFGVYMTQSPYYFQNNRINVDDISVPYCDSNWATSVKKELDKMYAAVAETLPQDSGSFSGDTYEYKGHTYKLYKQGNYNTPFGGSGKTIATSGCGCVSISICLSGYGINVDPPSLTQTCASKYGYTYAGGSVITNWLKEYGASGNYYGWGSNSIDEIRNHIKKGNPVIFNIGQGGVLYRIDGSYGSHPYGHFVALLGVDEEGNFFVGDPCEAKNGWVSANNLKNATPWGYYLVEKNN